MSTLADYCRTLADGCGSAWEDAPEQFEPVLKEAADTLTRAADEIERLRQAYGALLAAAMGDRLGALHQERQRARKRRGGKA
ncbi:MAG TPA: hypothetical protein VM487_18410 [Phycisphaerae bacterium]|nr:hypothetical protein [Phycisphaerae bacterium]